MKIYTRRGDDGTTGLLGAGRVLKSSARVEAYGSVDELNAVVGVTRTLDTAREFGDELEAVQAALFAVGAALAAPAPAPRLPRVTADDVATLESWIDRFESGLAPIENFILPVGSPLASQLHLARTVCRRAERRVVLLAQTDGVDTEVVKYLNRLADLLFVMARVANRRAGIDDVAWRPR